MVKKALNLETKQLCAMKVIKKQGNDEMRDSQRKYVEREVSILKQLRHPNIISLLDYFETRRKYYLVCELYLFHWLMVAPQVESCMKEFLIWVDLLRKTLPKLFIQFYVD